MNDQNVARNVGELGNINLQPLMYGGHALYCRKCMIGDPVNDGTFQHKIDGIFIPQVAADNNKPFEEGEDLALWLEVVGIGPNVGKPCSKAHARLHQRAKWFGDYANIGDLIQCPNMHATGIHRSPLASYEYFIEESVPVMIWRESDHKARDAA